MAHLVSAAILYPETTVHRSTRDDLVEARTAWFNAHFSVLSPVWKQVDANAPKALELADQALERPDPREEARWMEYAADLADSMGQPLKALQLAQYALELTKQDARVPVSDDYSFSSYLLSAKSVAERLAALHRTWELRAFAERVMHYKWTNDDARDLVWLGGYMWRLGMVGEAVDYWIAVRRALPQALQFEVSLFPEIASAPSLPSIESPNSALLRLSDALPAACSIPLARGLLLWDQNRLEEARRAVWKALECAPEYPLAWAHYGAILHASQQMAGAVSAWERALAMNEAIFDLAQYSDRYEEAIRIAGRRPPMALPGRSRLPDRAPASTGKPAARAPRTAGSAGSAVVLAGGSWILTAAHVVDACSSVKVRRDGEAERVAVVVARDAQNDLALLRTRAAFADGARLRSAELALGEPVYAAGFPLPGILAPSLNFTSGTVSSLLGPGGNTRLVQVTAPVAPGNSGGPLLDASGALVGLVVAKLDAVETLRRSGDLATNVGFAVRASVLGSFLRIHGAAPAEAGRIRGWPADAARRFTVAVECARAR